MNKYLVIRLRLDNTPVCSTVYANRPKEAVEKYINHKVIKKYIRDDFDINLLESDVLICHHDDKAEFVAALVGPNKVKYHYYKPHRAMLVL